MSLDPVVSELLKKLWRQASAPDANLGDAGIGPSPQKITLASAKRLLTAMEVRGDSSFYDIGCGQGLVCFAARLYKGCALAGGIELRESAFDWAEQRASSSGSLYCIFERDDLLYRQEISSTWDHVYAMCKDFPPPVLDRLSQWARKGRVWRVWASAHKWDDELLRDTGASLHKKLFVALCGSGERHRIWVYKR